MTDGPTGKPAFLSKERAEATSYPGSDERPRFDDELIAEDPAAPSPGIASRYREVARLKAYGKTNNEICEILGYTASRLSIIVKDPFVQAEVARVRDRIFDQDVNDRLKEVARDGVTHIHETIMNPKEKSELRSTNARWAIEKVTGKPRQEIGVESQSLNYFTDLLKDMARQGEVIDVSPKALPAAPGEPEVPAEQADPWGTWLDTNLNKKQP